MQKRLILTLIGLVVVLSMLMFPFITGCSQKASTPAAPAQSGAPAASQPAAAPSGQVITIRVAGGQQGITDASVPGRTVLQFIKDVESASNGKVKFSLLAGAAPDPELYDVVAKGAFDMSMNPIMFNSGRFPTLEAFTLPVIGTQCRHPSKAANELVKMYPDIAKKEFADTHLLAVWCATQSPPGISFTTVNKPLRKLEDFKGMKMGIYGDWGTKVVVALGGAPVAVPPPAVYESLQRKIVDGSGCDPEMLDSGKIYEVVKYWHYLNFQFVPFFWVMSNNAWNKLPADIQQIITEKAALMADRVDADFRDSTTRALDIGVKKYGMEVIDYTNDELNRWRAAQAPVIDEYKATLKAKGLDADKIFTDIKTLEDKYAEW
jgi:TRAP-type C4-dicarboxylate transport system substrate-binding protein